MRTTLDDLRNLRLDLFIEHWNRRTLQMQMRKIWKFEAQDPYVGEKAREARRMQFD